MVVFDVEQAHDIYMQHLSIPKRKLTLHGGKLMAPLQSPGQWEWMHFLFIYVHVYAFIPWLCSVKRHLSWQTSSLCSASLVSDLHIRSCLTLPPVEILVVDRLVVVFHGSPKFLNNFKCSRSVEKSYIVLTTSDFYDGTLAPKTDHFRGEGSNPLVKLIRGRIGSASRSDPTDWFH